MEKPRSSKIRGVCWDKERCRKKNCPPHSHFPFNSSYQCYEYPPSIYSVVTIASFSKSPLLPGSNSFPGSRFCHDRFLLRVLRSPLSFLTICVYCCLRPPLWVSCFCEKPSEKSHQPRGNKTKLANKFRGISFGNKRDELTKLTIQIQP